MSGALGETELAVEELEEAAVAKLGPQAAAVKVRESDEELSHRGVLAAEKIGEAGSDFACIGHEASIACDFVASPNARNRAETRARRRLLENGLGTTLRS